MRHKKNTVKLGRTSAHRDAMLSEQACSLIRHGRIRTTVPKAKASRRIAERMVTLGKRGTLAARRLALQKLQAEDDVKKLFDSVAPAFADRKGGYTRIVRIGRRASDGSEMAFLEWTNYVPPAPKERRGKKAEEEKKQDKPNPEG